MTTTTFSRGISAAWPSRSRFHVAPGVGRRVAARAAYPVLLIGLALCAFGYLGLAVLMARAFLGLL